MSTIFTNYLFQQEQPIQAAHIENSVEYVLEPKLSAEVDKILKIFHTINFLPLVEFINKENLKFETLLNTDEQQRTIENKQIQKPKPLIFFRKKNYNLRYRPYQHLQEKHDLFLEQKKRQEILDLIHSGVARTIIEEQYGIPSRTLKEWRALEIV